MHKRKIYHMYKNVAKAGYVTALCFSPPRPINMQVETWMICPENVTCPKCKKIMAKKPKA